MSGISASPANPDEQAIRGVVAEYGAAWNRHDMDAMATLFTDDAHWVNIVGWHWPGKAAVIAGHEAIHRSFFQKSEIEIGRLDVTADCAGRCRAHRPVEGGPFTPPDGVARPESEDRLSLVLAKRDGQWRITHGHNTVIDPAAKPFNPVKWLSIIAAVNS